MSLNRRSINYCIIFALYLNTMQSTASDYLPIAITFMVALGFVVLVMVVSHLVGPKNISKTKLEPFECGIEPQGNARVPFSIKYFFI